MGMLHIYCGDGKGKTTASLGLAIRGAGAGMKVGVAQFMKGGDTCELQILEHIEGITVIRCDREYGFSFCMTDEEKRDITSCHNRLLEEIFSGGYDMIILDEFNCAYELGFMDREKAEELIINGKNNAEIVLTGRNPADVFTEKADYISEICCRRHPYEKGVDARRGIEY